MAPETDTGQERTIPATPRRRQEARRKGQVAKSREVNSALMLMASLAALGLLGPRLLQGIGDTFEDVFFYPGLSGFVDWRCAVSIAVCTQTGFYSFSAFFNCDGHRGSGGEYHAGRFSV